MALGEHQRPLNRSRNAYPEIVHVHGVLVHIYMYKTGEVARADLVQVLNVHCRVVASAGGHISRSGRMRSLGEHVSLPKRSLSFTTIGEVADV